MTTDLPLMMMVILIQKNLLSSQHFLPFQPLAYMLAGTPFSSSLGGFFFCSQQRFSPLSLSLSLPFLAHISQTDVCQETKKFMRYCSSCPIVVDSNRQSTDDKRKKEDKPTPTQERCAMFNKIQTLVKSRYLRVKRPCRPGKRKQKEETKDHSRERRKTAATRMPQNRR
jgi:hypothetical protein